MKTIAQKQLDLLGKMSELSPVPYIIGGYAEDALIGGTVSRHHEDIDWIFPRREAKMRYEQLKSLGFKEFETWGDSSPGKPFYQFTYIDDLNIDIAVYDEADGRAFLQIGKLYFDLEGKNPPAGYKVYLPGDMLDQPQATIDGVRVRPVSPLTLYQMRIGIASQGSFGELGEKQLNSLKRLKDRFYPGKSDEELMPQIEKIK